MSLSELQGAVQAQCFCHDFPKGSSASQVCALLIHSLGVSSTPAWLLLHKITFKPIYFVMVLDFGVCLPWEIKRQHTRNGLLSPPRMEAAASSHREKSGH